MSLFDKGELHTLLAQSYREALERTESPKQARKLSRRAFLDWLAAEIGQLREEIAAVTELDPARRDERVERSRRDFHFFRRTYFPHYYRIEERSDLQRDLEEIYAAIAEGTGGAKFAVAAPRGFGKSTDVALTFLIWVIVHRLKHFPVLFSDAVELTEVHIEAIKAELEENPRLRQDFPEAVGTGPVWKVGDIVTKNGIRIKGYGSGKRVRGIKNGTHRPDLAIIDDLENDENVRSPKQRDKLEEWLDSAVDNLGGVDGGLDIVYIGTVLHRDSVLARKLRLAFWHPRTYRAILRYPDRMDLWDRYETLYRLEGAEAAHAFYERRRSEMEAGAKLLWEAMGLERLMQKRAANPRAFERELQNNPGSESRLFDSSTFRVISPTQCPPLARKFCYTDFKGDSVNGDYFAVIAGGLDRDRRTLYVYFSRRSRLKGRKAVDFLADLYAKERFYLTGGETNGGFYLYRDWFKDTCARRDLPIPNTRFVHNSEKKEDRIAELEFPLTDGDIVFVGEHPELFRELDDFPEAVHDDLSDVLAGLWRLARLRRRSRGGRRKRKGFKARRYHAYKG